MSCCELLNKFDDLVKRFKAEFNKIVEKERANLKAEVEALNAEKQRMEAIKVSDDDIIHLNVGGQRFSTTRATLCQVEGSLLATMFNEGGKIVLKEIKMASSSSILIQNILVGF